MTFRVVNQLQLFLNCTVLIAFGILHRLTSKRRKRRRLAVPSVECSTTGDLLMSLLDSEREEDLTQMLLEVL